MTRMCYEPLVYRGREQDGRERESGDKGTPLKAVMDEKGLERNCPLPSLHSLYETKMAASVGLKRGNILSPVKSNLRIIDGFSFALLFNQSNQVLIILHFVHFQIMRHNFVTNHHTPRNNESGTYCFHCWSRGCFDKLCLLRKYWTCMELFCVKKYFEVTCRD